MQDIISRGFRFPMAMKGGFDAAFAKLHWPLVICLYPFAGAQLHEYTSPVAALHRALS